jgi:hypothetical protein
MTWGVVCNAGLRHVFAVSSYIYIYYYYLNPIALVLVFALALDLPRGFIPQRNEVTSRANSSSGVIP